MGIGLRIVEWDLGGKNLRPIRNGFILVLLTFVVAGIFFKFPTGYVLLAAIPVAFLLGQVTGDSRSESSIDLSFGFFLVTLLLLFLGAGILRGYNLDGFGLRHDEGFIYQTALGYLHTGEFVRWDPLREEIVEPYPRSAGHSWLVAQTMKVFGKSPGTARWISWLFGMLLLPLGVWLAREASLNRIQTLLLLFLIAFSPHYSTLSRWIRMYVLFVPAFVLLTISLYRWMKASSGQSRLIWGTGVLISGGLSVHFHTLTLTVIPGLLVFLLWEWLRLRNHSHALLSRTQLSTGFGLLGMGLVGYVILAWLGWVYPSSISGIYEEFWGGGYVQPHYLLYFFEENLGYVMGGLVAGAVLFTTGPKPFERYLLSIVGAGTVVMVLFNPRLPQVRFMSHLMMLSWPLFLLAIWRIGSFLEIKFLPLRFRPILWLLVGFLVIQPLLLFPDRFVPILEGNMGYVTFPGTESPRYEKAYPRAVNRFGPRAFYLTCDPWARSFKPYMENGYRLRRISVNKPLSLSQLREWEQKNPVLFLPSDLPPCVDQRAYQYLKKYYRLFPDFVEGIDLYVSPGARQIKS